MAFWNRRKPEVPQVSPAMKLGAVIEERSHKCAEDLATLPRALGGESLSENDLGSVALTIAGILYNLCDRLVFVRLGPDGRASFVDEVAFTIAWRRLDRVASERGGGDEAHSHLMAKFGARVMEVLNTAAARVGAESSNTNAVKEGCVFVAELIGASERERGPVIRHMLTFLVAGVAEMTDFLVANVPRD